MGVVAVNTGNNLLYFMDALLLGFMGISGFFGKRNLEGIDLDVSLPDEIYANAMYLFKIVVRNKKRLFPSFLIRIKVLGGEAFIPVIGQKEERSVFVPLKFEKRGIYRIGDIFLLSVFPFNFFIRAKRIKKEMTIFVFPEPKRYKIGSSEDKEKDSEGNIERTSFLRNDEVISLRDYIKGDPPKFIHWKASAKTGDLKVKSFGSYNTSDFFIDFESIPIYDIEERLKAVTYAIVEAKRKQKPIGLKINGKIFKPTTSRQKILEMLKELSLYGRA